MHGKLRCFCVFFNSVLTAIAGQFPEVNQFRWVGWFNTALGMAAVVILVALFHGEYKSHNNNRSKSVTERFTKDSIKKLCQEAVTKPSLIRLSVSYMYRCQQLPLHS